MISKIKAKVPVGKLVYSSILLPVDVFKITKVLLSTSCNVQ